MERNQLIELQEMGFTSFILFDEEGFPIFEEGDLDTDIENFSETLSTSLSQLNNDYISWGFQNEKFIAFLLEDDHLFVGQLSNNPPISKIVFFINNLKKICLNFIKSA